MTTRRYFQFFLLVPVLLPLLAVSFGDSGPAQVLFLSLVIGGVPYLLFAAVLARRIGRAHPSRVPILVALSPVTFPPVQAGCTALAGLAATASAHPRGWGNVSVPDIVIPSLALGVVAGYFALAYVLVALAGYGVLRGLGRIDDRGVPSSGPAGTAPKAPRVVIATRTWFRWSPLLVLAVACAADLVLFERRTANRLAIHLLTGVAVISAPLMAGLSLYVDRPPVGRRLRRGDHELDPRGAIVLFWRSPVVLALFGAFGLVALKAGMFVSASLQGNEIASDFWSELPLLVVRWLGLSLAVGYAIVLASSALYLVLLRTGVIDDRPEAA
jgi:hypothetical protein